MKRSDYRTGKLSPQAGGLPQYVFAEAKAAISGLADGPLLRFWTQVEGEPALRHGRPGDLIEVKFVARPIADWRSLPNTSQTLWAELPELGLPAALLYNVCLANLLNESEPVRLTLDHLMKEIGWEPRSTEERLKWRRTIWRWLTVFEGWTVIGVRKGTYRDPVTHKVPDLWVDSALFRTVERGFVEPEQLALDGSAPPFEVTLAAGPWLSQFRGNSQILSYFGEVRRIAAIPARKAGGAWAQAIGLALQQRWRERAAKARVMRVGEEKHLTVDLGSFNRRDLLTLFPPTPGVEAVLATGHPGRAKTYWTEAIALLKSQGLIGYFKEIEPFDSGRQEWQDAWLDQPLDIRPDAQGTRAIAEIAKRARAARKQVKTPGQRS